MIKGITIDRNETKLLQYADDTTAVLSDISSAQILFRLLNDFEQISGLAVDPTTPFAVHLQKSNIQICCITVNILSLTPCDLHLR